MMNYPYAVGSIKVLEASILDRNKLAKLLKLDNKEFIKTLTDLGYGSSSSDSLETILNNEVKATKTLLDNLTPDKPHTDLFYFASDALNIKAMYKNKIFKLNNDIFVDTGVMEKATLEQVIYHEDYSALPKNLSKFFQKLNSSVSEETNPRLLSSKIDQAIFNYILKQNRNATLKVYFEAIIDFSNILSFIRSRNLNWDYEKFLEMFLVGGKVPQAIYAEAYLLQRDVDYLFKDYYHEKVTTGLKIYFEKDNLDVLERYFDTLTLDLMREYQYDSFGIGPIIYYYLEKQAEAKNIRMIYANSNIEVSDLLEY